MRTTLTNLTISIAAIAGASAIFLLMSSGGDRYDIFDLLKRRPLTGDISNPAQNTLPAPHQDPETIQTNTGDGDDLLAQINERLAQLTDAVIPSVVAIDTSTTIDQRRLVPTGPFGLFGFVQRHERYRRPGLGSGFLVSEDGHVLTNHHVVAGVDEIQITTHEGQTYKAEWIGSDPVVDIAVLKVIGPDGKKFPALKFGDSDKTRVGEMVLAVGNPFGLSETVTKGIISAKQRQLSDAATRYLQTDTVINPGNSGGPLVNVRGEIIGVNVALFTGQQNVRVWQGVGLAVPSNEAREVYEAIVLNKPLIRGYLGLSLEDVTPYIARQVGMSQIQGALVTKVAEDSPAEKSGLLPGDVLLSINGRSATSAVELINMIRSKDADTTVELEILRNGNIETLKAVITDKPDNTSITMRGDTSASGQSLTVELGIKVRNLDPDEKNAFGLAPQTGAVLITEVDPNSPAAKRLQKNDLILAINRSPVRNVDELYQLLGELPTKQKSVMTLSRNGTQFYAVLNPGQ